MKKLVKILIALFFILGSYYLGYFHANEKYSLQLNVMNEKLTISQSNVEHLRDSVKTLSKLLENNTLLQSNSLIIKMKVSK